MSAPPLAEAPAATSTSTPSPAVRGWPPALAVGAVLLLALGLRVWSVDWQLPWQFHPDEGHYVWKAVDIVQDGNLNPKYFRNPSLFTYLLALQLKLLDLAGLAQRGLIEGVETLRPPSLYVLLGRVTSALLGVANVALTIRLGDVLLGRPNGLLGGLLLAICFLHVRDSHFATNDVPATFFLTASVLASALLARSGRGRHAVLAGLLGGLATSAKYNAGFFTVPLLIAHGAAYGRRALTPGALLRLGGAGLAAAAGYLVGTPYTLLAWPTFRDDFLVQQRFGRSGWEGQGPEPVALLYLDALGQGLGWATLVFSALGFLLLARRRPLALALLAGYPVAYLGFMLGVKLFFARFAVPVLPFLCLAAAYGALAVARLARAGWPRLTLLVALTVGLVAQPLWNDVLHNRILSQPDTRVLAYAWLDANLPPQARLIVDDYSVRDRRPRADLPDRARFELDVVNALSERSLAAYRQAGYQYAVASSFQYQRFRGRADTYAELERNAQLVAVFTPTADGRELLFDIEELYSPFHDLARHARPGPTIKIYALATP